MTHKLGAFAQKLNKIGQSIIGLTSFAVSKKRKFSSKAQVNVLVRILSALVCIVLISTNIGLKTSKTEAASNNVWTTQTDWDSGTKTNVSSTSAVGSLQLAGSDTNSTLLLHADGTNNSTTFTDSSSSGHTVTANGNAKISSTQSKFGSTSGYLDGTNSSLTVPTSSDFDFADGNFTIDWWEYRTSDNSSAEMPVIARSDTGSYSSFLVGALMSGGNSNTVYMSSTGSSWDVASNRTLGTIDLNTWNHFAIVRSGTTFKTFKNGTQSDTWESSATLSADSGALSIGKAQNAGYWFAGYIDELRVSKGVARWTSDFSPPTSAYSSAYSTSGTDVVQRDSGTTGTTWNTLSWNGTTPTNTLIKARIRAADTQAGLSSASWSSYVTTSGNSVSNITGRYADIEWRLETTDTAATPTLDDGTVGYTKTSNAEITSTSQADWDSGTKTSIDSSTNVGSINLPYVTTIAVSGSGQAGADGNYVQNGTANGYPRYNNGIYDLYYNTISSNSYYIIGNYANSTWGYWDNTSDPTTGSWNVASGRGESFASPAPSSVTTLSSAYPTSGTDVIQYNSGTAGTTWSTISWNGTIPTNTLIKARIRAAATQAGLSSATYSSYVTTSGGAVTGITGQWAEVEWRLETTNTAATPTLADGTIAYTPGSSGSATWTTQADWQGGTVTHLNSTKTSGSLLISEETAGGYAAASAGDSNYNGTFSPSGTYGSSSKTAYTYNSRYLFSDYADMYGQDVWCLATSKQDLWDPYSQCDYYSTDANLPGTWYQANGASPAPTLSQSVGAYYTSGTDVIQYNSGTEDTTWDSISWNATTPTNTLIKARVRAANTQAGLSSATYSSYVTTSGGTVTGVSGQWVEIEWYLGTTDTAATPTLDDGNVAYTYPASATVPDAPTIGTATAGDAQASVAFTAPASDGGSAITGYTVTSTPGSLTGTGASSPITVTGLTNGTAYTFTVHATNSVGNSAESSASNQITPTAPGITVSGTCKQYDESTNCADSETVKIAVNGSLQAQTGSTSGGSWSISGITMPSAGDTLTVFVDGAADAKRANAVTKYSGSGDVTTMILYERHLVLGDGSQTLSNADIAKYDGSVSADNDIYFDVDASNNLTMPYGTTAQTDQKLFVLANNTWQPASSGAVISTVPKLVIPASATVTANANTIKLTGATDPLTVSGTFTAGTSTVEFAGTGAQNIPAATYNNLKTSNTSAATTQTGAVTIGATLTVDASAIYDTGGQNITAATLTNNGTFRLTGGESTFTITSKDTTHGTIEYNGTGTYSSLKYGNAYNNLTVSGSGSYTQNANATVAGAYSISAGTHSTGGYTLTTASTAISGGTLRIPNASFATKMTTSSFNQSGGIFNIGDYAYLDCNGTFTKSSGTTTVGSGSRFYISGDFVVSGASFGNSTTVLYLDGNTNAAVTTVPTVIGAIFRVAKGAAYTLTFNADPTFANFYVDSGNITTTGRTITMGTDGGTFGGGSQTVNNLVINANPIYLASSATIDGTLVINSGKALTNNTAANLTMTDAARLTLNGTATLGANSSGTGYYIFKDASATNLPTGGTISGKVRLQSDTKDISVPARTYQGRLEVYNSGSSNRVATLGTAGSQTITIGGHGYDNTWRGGLFILADGTGNMTVDGSVNNPTVNIVTGLDTYTTGYIDFAGTGAGSESIIAGSGTWTVKGSIDLTGGTLTAGGSTFVLNGTTSQPQTITSAGQSFNNLTIQNTATNGTTFADSATVSGTFTAATPSSKLTFNAGATYTIAAININGQASGTKVVMVSSSNGTHYHFNVAAATPTVSHTNIRDADASGGTAINAYDGTNTNSTGNTNIIFSAPAAPTIGTATRGNGQASITFTPPADTGGGTITGYTVTSTPGSKTGTGSSSPIVVTGLTNGTSYTFTVHATNAVGNSAESAATSAVTPATTPGVPTAVSATHGNAQATVSFTPPADTGGDPVTGYTVTSSPGGLTGTGATSPITVSGLTNGTSYTFTVHATNAIGNSAESLASAGVTPSTVPNPPTGATATGGNGQATITFTPPVADGGSAVTGYTVTSSPEGQTASGSSSPLTVTGLSNGTAYTFTIHATNINGNSSESDPSNSVTPATTPGAPTSISAVKGDGQATVSFTAPADSGGSAITGYTVTSSPDGRTVSGGSSPLTVSGLTNGTSYTFTVHATNAIGNSSESSASTAVTPSTVPGKPTVVVAVKGNQEAVVSFAAPADTGGSSITGYTVTSTPGSKTATGSASPLTVTGLTNGTGYTFTVHATNANGDSAESDASASVTPSAVPNAPTNVSGTRGNTQITLTYTPSTDDGGSAITGYTATSTPDGHTASAASGPLTVTGLTNGTAYSFTIHATNANGNSPESTASATVTPATTPSAPTIGTATRGDRQVTVAFTSGSDGGSAITGYTVSSEEGGFTASGSASPITVTGLTNGVDYRFSVHATNDVGNSAESDWTDYVVPAAVPGAPTNAAATRGNGSATISFTAPASHGSPITSYTVTSTPEGHTATGSSSPITISGLANGTSYSFTVHATSAVGDGSESSSTPAVTPATIPGVPSGVTGMAGNGQAVISFLAPDNGGTSITNYTVISSPGNKTATGSTSPITVTGLTNGTAYTFTVVATNEIGDGEASTASGSITPMTVPGVPTGVNATAGDAEATISFTAPASTGGAPITSYTVTSSPGNIKATGSASPITVPGLANGTIYTFTVHATNIAGSGAESSASANVTPQAPPAPTPSPTPSLTPAPAEIATSSPSQTTSQGPKAVFSMPASIEINQDFSLNGASSTSNVEITSYKWSFGDNETASGINVTHRYSTPGVKIISLTVTNQAGNKDTSSQQIAILPPPPVLENISISGKIIKLSGSAYPLSTVVIEIHSDPITITTQADKDGKWSAEIDTEKQGIATGKHQIVLASTISGAVLTSSDTQAIKSNTGTYSLELTNDDGKLEAQVTELQNSNSKFKAIAIILGALALILIGLFFVRKYRLKFRSSH